MFLATSVLVAQLLGKEKARNPGWQSLLWQILLSQFVLNPFSEVIGPHIQDPSQRKVFNHFES